MTFLNVPAAIDWPVQLCATVTAVVYLLSVITSNVSQVDRSWTFLPTIYTAYYALLPLWPYEQKRFLEPYAPKALGWAVVKDYSPRTVLMFGLIVIWMCRLSYNTHRRGLFSFNDEDYRWAVLRQQIPPWLFQLTNLVFIALAQNVLLLLLGMPACMTAVLQPHDELATSDYILAATALALLAIEFIADNQQYAYQSFKQASQPSSKERYNPKEHWPGARLHWTPSDAKRGFVTKGLWRWSRHPNAACEQAFWWVINLFPILAPSPPDLPPYIFVLPASCLTALIISSTIFTESISKRKYPACYDAYQKHVGMFLPFKALFTMFFDVNDKKTSDLVWGEIKNTD